MRALADRGNAGAQANLADLYLVGLGVEQSGAESARRLRMAAEQNDGGNRARKYALGLKYFRGEGVAQDYAEAARWFAAAADLNGGLSPDIGAERLLALIYRMGFGVEQDHDQAEYWHCRAFSSFGRDFTCIAGPADPGVNHTPYERRVRWAGSSSTRARAAGAREGNPADLYFLVDQYYRFGYIWGYDLLPNHVLPSNLEGSVVAHPEWAGAQPAAWLLTLAEGGDPDAQYHVGQMYANGFGAPQDDAEAVKWYRAAAEQGRENAHFELSLAYRYGRGVPQDAAESVRRLRMLADRGNARAQYNLAWRYRMGDGLPQDNAEYVWLLLLAGGQNYSSAYVLLGDAYLRGEGVAQDYAEAAKWYGLHSARLPSYNSRADRPVVSMSYYGKIPPSEARDASISKLVNSPPFDPYLLGLMRYHGNGVPQDVDEALRLLREAANLYNDTRASLALAALHDEGVASPDIGGGVILADLHSATETGAPNALATAFGTAFAGLGAQALGALDESGRLSTQAGGVCLSVDGFRAPLLFVSSNQINFQVPAETSGRYRRGAVVEVISGCGTAGERRSGPAFFAIAARSPRFFVLGGIGTLIALHGGSGALVADSALIPGAAPAKPGDVVVLYGTGFGAVSPALASGELAQEARGVTANVSARLSAVDRADALKSTYWGASYLGNVYWEPHTHLYAAPESGFAADVLYAGAAPGFAGLYQLNLRIPENAPAGILGLRVTIDGGDVDRTSAIGLIPVAEE